MGALRRLSTTDVHQLRRFWAEHWAGEEILVHGHAFAPENVEGFVNEDWTGLVTFVVSPEGCEIVSLDSLEGGRGTGTQLIEVVAQEAARRGCLRLFLSTTNDNLDALRFYQRRGFQLAALHRGAVTRSRERKPGIPEFGQHGIPLRDEIVLERALTAANDAAPP